MAAGSIGRLQAALAAATNEVTVAAANINFDFTLVKYEAPKEYHGLGALLSAGRKQDAESGNSHITARRLAALFKGTCPETPRLIAAYGERVSEISKVATSGISNAFSESVFSAFTGVDATSIWAAATSSQSSKDGAIHVHLLACLLASIWHPPEAISIWTQLISERRKNIAEALEKGEPLPFSTAAAAAQQDISRSQLAAWDSSARAWIQTAEEVKVKSQTQLKLILKNVALNIDKDATFYLSVMETWRTALGIMENLISGIPQQVQDGIALLSISAWNIYPDIHVFGQRNVEVSMKDALVPPGGILTVGCSSSATTPSSGISWSLSLSQLRYYGHAVSKVAVLHEDPSKLSCSEFRQVILGCILQIWQISEQQQTTALRTLDCILEAMLLQPEAPTMVKIVCEFLQQGLRDFWINEETGIRLLNLGRKRPNFIPSQLTKPSSVEKSRPFFGLLLPTKLMEALLGTEERLTYLRRICGRHLHPESLALIRYYSSEVPKQRGTFATVFPRQNKGGDREDNEFNFHQRWFPTQKSATEYRNSCKPMGRYEREEVAACKRNQFEDQMPTSFSMLDEDGEYRRYAFLFGHSELASVFTPAFPIASQLNATIEDLLWAVEHGMMNMEGVVKGIEDEIIHNLVLISQAMDAFETIQGNVILERVLHGTIQDAHWAQSLRLIWNKTLHTPTATIPQQVSMVSYFVAGCNIPASEIPSNVLGISAGSSLFVVSRVSQVRNRLHV